MAVEMVWIIEPRIRLVHVTGALTEEDLKAWIADDERVFDLTTEPMHSIVDLTGMTKFELNPLKMPNVMDTLKETRRGWAAIVGVTPIVAFWLEMLTRFGNLRFKIFPNVQEATDFLTSIVRIADQAKSEG